MSTTIEAIGGERDYFYPTRESNRKYYVAGRDYIVRNTPQAITTPPDRRPRSLYFPQTVRDTSEAACDTAYDASMYQKLANLDPRQHLFKVLNPATTLPDEVFTACVIQRYRLVPPPSDEQVLAANVQI